MLCPKNVLLVDENQLAAPLVEQELVRRLGQIRLTTASNAQEALTLLRREKYGVAVLNLALPDLSGLELLELLRLESIDVPVIAVAEAGSARLAVDALKAGAVDYLPIDPGFPESVAQTIEELLWEDGRHPAQRDRSFGVCQRESHEATNVAAATLSHEINNPLMTILGTAELLLSDPDRLDKETEAKARVILRSARRIEKRLRKLSELKGSTMRETASGRLLQAEAKIPVA